MCGSVVGKLGRGCGGGGGGLFQGRIVTFSGEGEGPRKAGFVFGGSVACVDDENLFCLVEHIEK